MTFDFTSIFEGLLIIFLAIITKILIPYVKTKISIQSTAETEYWVKLAVQAIEQISFTSGQKGKEKKEYVINWLKEHNIKYDEEKIDAQIESAVYQLKIEAIGLITPNKEKENDSTSKEEGE